LYQSPFKCQAATVNLIDLSEQDKKRMRKFFMMAAAASLLAACQPGDQEGPDEVSAQDRPPVAEQAINGIINGVRVTAHRDGDDLITAGLGLDGLRAGTPAPADPNAPTAAELRVLAIYTSWTSLAALNPAGGLGGLFSSLPEVPGREFAAFRRLPEATHPVRLLVQVPDAFDLEKPCLVVAPASGSRGVYGAIALAGTWALPGGCATVYTDKGAGTDFFDFSDATGVALSGLRSGLDEEPLGFALGVESGPEESAAVGMSHAHSRDHPEADWGLHVLDAARFGLEVLNLALQGEFTAANTRIIATGLSNGGGAVLRAAEQDEEGLLDAVVALMPNISPPGVAHAYDYATLAALYQPCMLADLETTMAMPLGNPMIAAAGAQRCAALTAAGLLAAPDADLARQQLVEFGFDEFALNLAPVNVALDLWRSVAVTYASAYLRRGPFDMPCDFGIAAPDATEAQRLSWWATHSGIAPGGGIDIIDNLADGRDQTLPGLICLRELYTADTEQAGALRQAVEATRASAQLPPIPVLIVHGRDDGLIPAAFSGRPYAEQARENGATVAYWEVANAQHFDALLAAPAWESAWYPSCLTAGTAWITFRRCWTAKLNSAPTGPSIQHRPHRASLWIETGSGFEKDGER